LRLGVHIYSSRRLEFSLEGLYDLYTRVTGTSDTEAWKNQFNNQRDQNSAAPSSGQVIDDDEDEDDEEDDNQTLSVPLTVTILMLAFYIFMGALLFGVWESWDWLVASYFCFITISTIGFGDFVPGYSNSNEDTTEQLKMIGAAVYIVLGMALMSMAFNLIQEEMVVKFKWLGSKMGLVKKEDDDDDDDEGEAEEPDQHQHPQQQQAPAAMMGGYPHPTSSMPPRQVGPGGPGPMGPKNAMAPSAGPMAAQKAKPFYPQEHDKNK
jgi:Ion channel